MDLNQKKSAINDSPSGSRDTAQGLSQPYSISTALGVEESSSIEIPSAFIILIPDSERQSSKYIQINAGTMVNETGTGGRLCK